VSWLIDTDVISQPAKTSGHPGVIAWLEKERDDCYTSTIVIAQLAHWSRTKEGKARVKLQRWLHELLDALEGRVLSFNVSTAHAWADLKVAQEEAGERMPIEDSYIAATARRHHLTIATGNDRHFCRSGLKVFNPFLQRAFP
jgi:predicted nucleic acid-binding protein